MAKFLVISEYQDPPSSTSKRFFAENFCVEDDIKVILCHCFLRGSFENFENGSADKVLMAKMNFK